MTAKDRVKAKRPKAYAAQDVDGFWHIWCPTERRALSGGQQDTRSAATAWKWAAERLTSNVEHNRRTAASSPGVRVDGPVGPRGNDG